MVSVALERTCDDNAYACVLRFAIPGLPNQPLTGGGAG
jgi:hypothetical protein